MQSIMTKNILLAVLLLGLAVAVPAAESDGYDYPYKEPYLATLSSALLRSDSADAAIDKAVTIDYLTLFPERAQIDEIKGQRELVFQLYRQAGVAPLVYVLGGIGANVFSGASRYTADILFREGFHVIILPSPFNWNFTLTASSSGLPGVTDEDAADIYNVMKATLAAVKAQYGIEVTRIGAVGFSLGALQLAYVSEIDRLEGSLNVERFLLINPPVELETAVDKIGELNASNLGLDPATAQRLVSYAFGWVLNAWASDINDPAYFADLDKRFKVNQRGRRFLIGYAMQLMVDQVISVSETLNRRDLLAEPSPLATELLGAAKGQKYTFGEYMNELVLPVWAERLDTDNPLEQLRDRVDLVPLLPKLGANKEIFAMHNADDFIVTPEQLQQMKQALGDRMTVYPLGGHLGNLWFEPNKQHIREVFAPLKQ
jgi:hypothetical protein